MNTKIQSSLLLIATILSGLLSGFFYTWSFSVIQSLDLIGDINAASAMIAINANIRTAWFGAIFFGAPLLIFVSFLMVLKTKDKNLYPWIIAAFGFSFLTVAITFSQHLPLNSELENGASWSSYFDVWLQWNHVRLVTSLIAFICMLCACCSNAASCSLNK